VRLLILTQYYAPETGAAQTRLAATALGLMERGLDVTVLAPAPSYPSGIVPGGYSSWRPTVERIDRVRVVRLPSIIVPGARISRRIVGQATFAAATLAAVALAPRYDVALVESPPLLLGIPARVLAAAGLPYVFHVADPWPDFPIALGYLRSPIARRAAFALEALAYRGASAITTVSPPLVQLLQAKPSAAGKVSHIPNTVDVARFATTDRRARRKRARDELGWNAEFTAVYAGTVGLAQGLDTLVDAAALVTTPMSIRIYGDGVEREALARRATNGVATVTFHDPVPAARVPDVLAAADVGLVMLKRGGLYEASLPTKLLEAMAAGLPVVVSADGLAARIVTDSDGGFRAPAEDAAGLARALDRAAADPDRAGRANRASAYVAEHYDRSMTLDRLAGLLQAVAGAR
jgi:glycosyltransferase involved in cell wall biosynthesis